MSTAFENLVVYAPTITSPFGGEIYNLGTVEIAWSINDPPTSDSGLELSDITYELEYTDDYKGDGTVWVSVKKRISGADTSFSWQVGRMIKSSTARMRIRARSLTYKKYSEYSTSGSDFSINVFDLRAPAIVKPIGGSEYSDFVSIILDESMVYNTHNQKVRYGLSYYSASSGDSWNTIYSDISPGTNYLRWDVSSLPSAIDYRLRLTVSDVNTNQYAESYVDNISIKHPGLFIIDTKPPIGYIEFDKGSSLTNSLDHVLNLYVEDESTAVSQVKLRERDANGLLTIGRIIDGEASEPITDLCDFSEVKVLGSSAKVPWRLTDQSGLRRVEAYLIDYGGNTSCDVLSKTFMSIFNSSDAINDSLIIKELKENISIENNQTVVETGEYDVLYVCTEAGVVYKLEPYSESIYTGLDAVKKICSYDGLVYFWTYGVEGKLYRHDYSTTPTLISTFTTALSEVTSYCVYEEELYFGMSNGQLWKYDGSAVALVEEFSVSISSLWSDTKLVYIGFFGGSDIQMYNGVTFSSASVNI